MSKQHILPAAVIAENEIPLRAKYLVRFSAKFGGKKRKTGNSGGCGRAGRRKKKLYLAVNSGPEWKGPPRT